jgi:hypothetical protein
MKITLSEKQLESVLEKALTNACGFEWTGWRIPIYVTLDEENKGIFSSGGWLSNNSWQPDALEVYKIEKWDLIEEENVQYNEEWTKNHEIEDQIYYILDDNSFEIKRTITVMILNHFENKFIPMDEEIEKIKIEWEYSF